MASTHDVKVRFRQEGAEGVSRATDRIGKSASAAASALRTMRQFLVIASFFRAASGLLALNEAMDDLADKVNSATRFGNAFTNNLQHIGKLARETRSSITDVGDVYARLAISADRLGLSQDQLDSATTNIIKGYKMFGASSKEAASGIDALFSRMENGKIQSRQLLTLLKESPPLAKLMASALNLSARELTAFVQNSGGLVDVGKIMKGIAEGSEEFAAGWAAQSSTIGEAITNIANSFSLWLYESQQGSIVMAAFIKILDVLAYTLNYVMPFAIAAIVAAMGLWIIKIQQTIAASKALATAMAFLKNHPFLIIASGIALAASVLSQFTNNFQISADGQVNLLGLISTLWDKVTTAISAAVTWVTNLWNTVTGGSQQSTNSLTLFGSAVKFVVDIIEILSRTADIVFQGMIVVVLGFQAAWEVAVNAVSEVWVGFVNLLKSTANFVIGVINAIFGTKIQPFLKEEIQATTDAVKAHAAATADLAAKLAAADEPLEYFNNLMKESKTNANAASDAYDSAGHSAADAGAGLDKASSAASKTASSMASGANSADNFASSLSNVATQAGLAANGMAKLNMQTFQGGSYTGGAVNLQQASAGGGFTGSGFSSGISQQGVGNMGLVGTGTGLGLGSMSSSGTMSFSSSAGPEMRAIQQQLIAFYKSIGDDSKAWQISQMSTSSFGGPGWENPLLEWRGMLETMNNKIAKMEANQQKQIAIAEIEKQGILTLPDRIALAQQNISQFYGREEDIVYQSQLQSMIAQGRLLPGQGGASGNVGQVGWGSGGGNLVNPNTWLGMASGGAFQMPGNFGGKDSMLAALRLAPGEEVHVRRPRDRKDQERGRINPPANYNITFNVQTPDADSFRHNQTQMGQSLLTAIRRAERQRGVR